MYSSLPRTYQDDEIPIADWEESRPNSPAPVNGVEPMAVEA